MKILFHLNSMGRGGAEHVVSILSKKFADKGNEVIIANEWISENEYEIDSKVKRIMVGLTPEDDNKSRIEKAFLRLERLRACIKKENPDLVISFCAKANFRAAFSLIGIKTPLVVSVRNNPQTDYKSHKLSTWIMEKKASGCVFQTPDARNYFSKRLQDKSKIIFNPLDEAYLEYEVPEILERKKEIVTVGRISEQKNQLLLLKAFNSIKDKCDGYVIKIYGDIQEEEVYKKLEDYILENKLEDRVSFMGTSNNLKEEIKDAGLFVLPSDYEGMPNALIEAMTLGLSCIATDCPCGGSKLLLDGDNGILTRTGDPEDLATAILELINNPDKARLYGKNAAKIKTKVHPDKICQEWEDFLNEIR